MCCLKRFLLLFFILSFSLTLFAQNRYASRSKKAIAYYEKAIGAMELNKYSEVLDFLNLAQQKDDKFTDVFLLRAEVYRLLNDFEREAKTLEHVVAIDPDYFPFVYYNLGVAYYKSGEYIKGVENLEYFINQGKAKPVSISRARNYVLKCKQAQELKDHPVPFEPLSLGDGINNTLDQYWPSLSLDGKTMVYTVMMVDSTRKNIFGNFAHQEDFYKSSFNDSQWLEGIPLGAPINTPGNEGAQQLSADGKTLVFTGCNRDDGFGNCDIYISTLSQAGWSIPENMGPVINSRFSEKQPTLSPDGRKLFFSSDRPGGIGGMDIWEAERLPDGKWKQPRNMGRVINTVYDEGSPFIFADNKSMYFSSMGHIGLGMNDIFFSRLTDSSVWSKPVNLGYHVNSHRDEIGLVIAKDGRTAYFASTLVGGNWDIYQFDMPLNVRPNPVSYVSGFIFDADDHRSLAAEFQLLSLSTGDTIIQTKAQADDGSYLVCLPLGDDYALNVSHPSYLFRSVHFSLNRVHEASQPYLLNIGLNKIQVGKTIVLENVFFAKDSFNILPQSLVELNKIVEFVQYNPKLHFEIGGHTDNSGSEKYNLLLSEKRAEAVYNYVIGKLGTNINLSYKGYGQSQTVAPDDTPENMAKNRRTELKVIEKK
jgi:outer membrane protein OmpA-like peptidoglycan-associated protein/Tol biopolymer transport system component